MIDRVMFLVSNYSLKSVISDKTNNSIYEKWHLFLVLLEWVIYVNLLSTNNIKDDLQVGRGRGGQFMDKNNYSKLCRFPMIPKQCISRSQKAKAINAHK